MSGLEGPESSGSFSLDKEFLNSLKGRLILAELVLCFVIFICFAASISSYLAAALLEFIITLIFLILFSSRYHLRLTALNWPCTDFLRCVSAAVVFLVVSIVAAARSSGDGGAITAACPAVVSQYTWTPLALIPLFYCGNVLVKPLTMLITDCPEIGREEVQLFGFILVSVFSYDAFTIYKTEITDRAADGAEGAASA